MPDFEGQIKNALLDSRLSGDQRRTLERLDRELRAHNVKVKTRLGYAFHLRRLGLYVAKPFEDVSKEDFLDFFDSIAGWKSSSITVCKAKIKRFYKWLDFGSLKGKKYPERVEWISTSSSGNDQVLPFNLADLLTHEDVNLLLSCCYNPRDKAILSLLYESGGRASEVLDMTLKDVKIEQHGARVALKGKTGERAHLMPDSTPYLTLWLNHHPLRHLKNRGPAALWVNFKTKKKLSYNWLYTLVAVKLKKRSGIEKPLHPHLFRHSQATYCAHFMSYAQLCEFFGWKIGSRAPMIYIHLAGKDLDDTILAMRGRKAEEKPNVDLTLSPKVCTRCKTENPGDAKFCNVCGLVLDEKEAQEIMAREAFSSEFLRLLEAPDKRKKFKAFLEGL